MSGWYVARTRGYCAGWTIEAFRCSSGGWWFDVYSALNGQKIDQGANPRVHSTIQAAHRAGNALARKHKAPIRDPSVAP